MHLRARPTTRRQGRSKQEGQEKKNRFAPPHGPPHIFVTDCRPQVRLLKSRAERSVQTVGRVVQQLLTGLNFGGFFVVFFPRSEIALKTATDGVGTGQPLVKTSRLLTSRRGKIIPVSPQLRTVCSSGGWEIARRRRCVPEPFILPLSEEIVRV